MSLFAKSFAGAQIILPGVYTYTDLSAMVAPGGTPARAIAIVASGRGGAVGALTRISTQKQVKDALISGDAAHMAKLALDAGATDLYIARVNQAEAATTDLGDLAVAHRNPGTPGNRTQFTRQAATDRQGNLVTGAVNILVRDNVTGRAERYDAVGPLVQLSYVGGVPEGASAVVSEASGASELRLSDGVETVTVSADGVADLRTLIEIVNTSSTWTARLSDNADAGAPLGTILPQTYALTNGGTTLQGGARAQARVLNASQIVSAEAKPGGTPAPGLVFTAFLGGGKEGPVPTPQDYINALALLEGIELIAVVMGTADGAALAAGRSHVYAMSSVKARRERSLYIGHRIDGAALSQTKQEFIDKFATTAATLGGDRVIIACNQPFDYDLETGDLGEVPSYYLAAYAAGYKAARRPEESLTNKPVTMPGFKFLFGEPELEDMSVRGGMICNNDTVQGRPMIIDGITSHTASAVFTQRSIAGMDILDYLSKRIRIVLHPYIGAVGDRRLPTVIRLRAEEILKEETRGSFGVLTTGNDKETGNILPSYEKLEVIFDGISATGVRYECHPVGENKYVFVESAFTPIQISA